MKVLVCGGRDFKHPEAMAMILDGINRDDGPITLVMHGGARGADTMAGSWAKARHIPVQVFEADWIRHPRAGGVIRNARMLVEGRPDLVVGFPGGTGTADMMAKALKAGVKVMHIAPLTPETLAKMPEGLANELRKVIKARIDEEKTHLFAGFTEGLEKMLRETHDSELKELMKRFDAAPKETRDMIIHALTIALRNERGDDPHGVRPVAIEAIIKALKGRTLH